MAPNRAVYRAIGFLTAAIVICLPATTQAQQTVTLQATLQPERLGQSTTIGFGFQIVTPPTQIPSPLTSVDVSYPVELGFALSELGLAKCTPATLETFGPEGCPADSIMGYGTAIAELPVESSLLYEPAQVTIVRTTEQAGHLALLIYADGKSPVSAQIMFPGLVVQAPAPYGGRLDMTIPLVRGLPEGPDVAIVRFHSTIGPEHLTYYEHHNGKIHAYQPRGIPLPTRCPHNGFTFTAKLTFLDGSHTTAHSHVLCPKRS